MNYVAPDWNLKAFHCPHCNAHAEQHHYKSTIYFTDNPYFMEKDVIGSCICNHCHNFSLWIADYCIVHNDDGSSYVDHYDSSYRNYTIIYPDRSNAPHPNPDMPENIMAIYEEASSICMKSPRSAAALLRLCIEMICDDLKIKKGVLFDRIGYLVAEKGLPKQVQEAFDTIRVSGNDIHPGQIMNTDNPDTVSKLFGILNFIVQFTHSIPKQIDSLYTIIPPNKVKEIEKRNKQELV